LRQVNYAEIMQLKIYLTDLRLCQKLYEQSGRSWEVFFREIKTIEEERKRGDVSDPFQLLRNKVRAQS